MIGRIALVMIAACLAMCLGLMQPPAQAEETLSYADLVGRLTDLERLAVLPQPGETCRQWSSYDRASQYDEKTGNYVRWDANGDGGGIIRREGDAVVMAEMDGPGCIWRIWSARPQSGHVKIFLDGSDQPAVDMPFQDYFDGKHAPFNYSMLSYRLEDLGCRGQNLYQPIPYQKSCKIVAEKGWGNYYHFTFATYPKGTRLPTFSAELAAQNADALAKADAFLRDRLGTDPAGERPGRQTAARTVRVAAGQSAKVVELTGPAAITAIRAKAAFKDRDDEMAALRHLVLRITWDGEAKPAVWCPLGDFFGTAPGVNLYKSLPTGMTADGWYALWYMPFGRSAAVELVNDGPAEREVQFEIAHAPLTRPLEGLGRFHCKWHRDLAELPKDRSPDWTLLTAEGRGRFCGVMLHVWNPKGGWWGEGDEKFFVDGEKFPSTIGTGSEDYFGYAWGDPHLFQRPYHCQTMTQNNKGHQSLLRWHVVDNVPFQTSFEGVIEKYFHNDGALYACTVVSYLSPGGGDPLEPVPAEDRHGYYEVPRQAPGGFTVVGEPKGTVETQGMAHYSKGKWKNDDQLFWRGGKPGDKLELIVPVKKAAVYQVSVVLTKARDYGIVQLHLDGKKAGGPIDLYNPEVTNTDPLPLGTHELAAGDHRLTVEIVGANPQAAPAHFFGLDYLIFEAAK